MMLHELPFDKIFCINLPKDIERKRHASEELRKAKLLNKTVFFDAIYAKELRIKHNEGNFTPGMVGCFLSHYFIFHEAVRYQYDMIFVTEDDLFFTSELENFEKYWKTVPKDWEFIWLGYSHYPNQTFRKMINEDWVIPGFTWGTQAYIVRGKKNIRRIYEELKVMHDQVDVQLVRMILPEKIRTYAIYPYLVGQMGGSVFATTVQT